jgi:hypothetical protein
MLTDFRILLVLGGVAGALVIGTAVVVSQRAEDRFRRERADQEARWETDRAAYELQLSQAHQSVLQLPEPESAVSAPAVVPGVGEQAERWLEQLQSQPEAASELGRRPLRRVVHANGIPGGHGTGGDSFGAGIFEGQRGSGAGPHLEPEVGRLPSS